MPGAVDATYTVMFTDLVDSTAQRARLGDDAADELHLRHQAILSDVVAQHHGTVVKTTGDGIMAAFTGAADGITRSWARSRRRALGRARRRGSAPRRARTG